MFVVFQHPFADLRDFIGPGQVRLQRPQFPLASIGSEFIRSSGQVTDRRRGGVAEWAGEEFFARAANALKFPNHLGQASFGAPDLDVHVECAFRRFHSNGRVARWEAGLRLIGAEGALERAQFVSLLREMLEIPVRVQSQKTTKAVTLAEAGEPLAQHYLLATTPRKPSTGLAQHWWFAVGEPMLLVELLHDNARDEFLPPHTTTVFSQKLHGVGLFHCWLRLRKKRCSTWFLICQSSGDREVLRRIRIHLVRLHAERNCLRVVLQRIRDGTLLLKKGDERSDAIQEYLNEAVALLKKPQRYGLDQKALFDAAQYAFGVAFEGESASLGEMRRQVSVKVRRYIESEQSSSNVIQHIYGDLVQKTIQLGNVSVAGDFTFVTADNIQNSFNKTTSSDANQELKEALKTLSVQVAELAKKLPPEKAEQVATDLHTLTSEALSKQPRRKWYELSKEGLLEAAKTVGEMLPNIAKSVAAVAALIGL